MGRATFALAACLAAAGCTVDPGISEIKPPSLDACDTIAFTGVYADIQQVAVVDSAGAQTPMPPTSLKRTDQSFGLAGPVPLVAPGTYRLFMDQKGGWGGYFIINSGSFTTTQTFQVVSTPAAPTASLSATDSNGPGQPATLTPTITGTTTSRLITPGSFTVSSGVPKTVNACKTTTYTLTARNKCAPPASASATVHVPAPTVTAASPASVTAGANITVTGTAFAHNVAACGPTTAALLQGSTTYDLAQVATTSTTSLTALVTPCTPAGTYTVVVTTSAGKSTSPVRLVVAASPAPCPDDGNPCTKETCSGGVCKHPNAPNGTACGPNATCSAGVCKTQATPNPTCIAENQNCSSSADCCQPAKCYGTPSKICKKCIPTGSECGAFAGGQNCCDNGAACAPAGNNKDTCQVQ